MRNLLLDEHVPSFYRVQLRRHQPALKIWMVGEVGAPPKGTLDPDLLIWCEEHDFLLVTNNRSSMPQHLADHLAANRHVPGVLVLRRDVTIGQIIECLRVIAEVSVPEDFWDRIEFVPLQ
jgi:hypothetical protein